MVKIHINFLAFDESKEVNNVEVKSQKFSYTTGKSDSDSNHLNLDFEMRNDWQGQFSKKGKFASQSRLNDPTLNKGCNFWWLIVANYQLKLSKRKKMNHLKKAGDIWWWIAARYQLKVSSKGKTNASNCDVGLWWWIIAKYQIKFSSKEKMKFKKNDKKNKIKSPTSNKEVNLWWWIVTKYLVIVSNDSRNGKKTITGKNQNKDDKNDSDYSI